MTTKKTISLLLSVLLLIAAVVPGFSVFAQNSATITFLFTDGTDIYPFFDLTVADGAAEAYGFRSAENDHAGKPVDTVTALDALVAAHAAFYGDSFTAQTAGDFVTISYGFASKAFGQSGSFGFVLNDATPHDGVLVTSDWGSYYTGYALDTTRIQNGDVVMLYKYTDTAGWSDLYPVFHQNAVTATAGESVSVSASGYSIMTYGCSEQSIIDANTIPMAGAQLFLTQDFKTYTPAGSFDETGNASVSAPDEGTWYLVIRGTVGRSPVIPNFCKLTVQENPAENARWFPVGFRPFLSMNDQIITAGVTIIFRDLHKKAADCRRTYAVRICLNGMQTPIRFICER